MTKKEYEQIKKEIRFLSKKQILNKYKATENKDKLEVALKIYNRSILNKNQTVREQIQKRLQTKFECKLNKFAGSLPVMGYSMGSRYVVKFNIFSGKYSTCSEYARSSKYVAKHGYYLLNIDKNIFDNSDVIGGLFTYIYPNQKAKVKKCWWFESDGFRQFYELKKVEGFIFNGYHSTTKEGALNGGNNKIKIEKENIKNKKLFNKSLRKRFSFDDSLKCGNCEAGTRAFILRCGLDANKKYRGDFLLKIAKEKSSYSLSYINRMINYFANNL